MINSVVLVSCVQQSDSVIHVFIVFQVLFPFRLLQNVEQSSLCYTVGPCWLSILNIAVCICQSQRYYIPFFMSNIPLYGYTAFCLSVHCLTDISLVSTFVDRTVCQEHPCTGVCLNTCFQLWGYTPRSGIAR